VAHRTPSVGTEINPCYSAESKTKYIQNYCQTYILYGTIEKYATCTYVADIFELCKVQFDITLFQMVQGERRKRI